MRLVQKVLMGVNDLIWMNFIDLNTVTVVVIEIKKYLLHRINTFVTIFTYKNFDF